jgi:predicted transcriptional regulator
MCFYYSFFVSVAVIEQLAEVIDEEIYDDVDVTKFPPTPSISR